MKLEEIMREEFKVLQLLYEALLEQNKYLIKKEVFSLDKIVKVIDARSKDVAKWEIERRKITKKRPMREIIAEKGGKDLENLYNSIVEVLRKMQFQKDTNEVLIKQWLGFTNQMLRALNPNRGPNTYNALGRSR
ncbi:flagellar protein FlgN [Clostridium sp. LBM24168]